MVYRAMIRSVLDYGCIAFDSAPKSTLAKLDVVQSKALSICTAALGGTAVSSLQVDCGEMPLSLRRTQILMDYTAKIRAIPDHPTQSILRKGRVRLKRMKQAGEALSATKMERVEAIVGSMTPEPVTVTTRPPWRSQPPEVDLTLQDYLANTGYTHVKHAVHRCLQQYSDRTFVYTDGSFTNDGRASSCFHVPSLDYHEAYRLTNGTSIYAAEMVAILKAMEWVNRTQQTNTIVLSDCQSVLQSMMQQRSQRRPMLLQRLLATYEDDRSRHPTTPTILVWIPSHMGIDGNETADKLCRQVTRNPCVDLEISLEYRDMQERYRAHCISEWQKLWETSLTGTQYRKIEPTVGRRCKYTDHHRRKEVCISRLRFGRCRLNVFLNQIGCHDDGKCANCDLPETVEHYLLNCPVQRVLQDRLKADCRAMSMDLNLRTALSNKRCIETIYAYVDETKKHL